MPGDDHNALPAVAKRGEPPSYWQAAISALPPDKQAAAWRFFQERELGVASGATDTLSGFVLLMEANGLFMDGCAEKIARMLITFEAGLKTLPASQVDGSGNGRAAVLAIPENIGPQANRIAALVQRLETAGGEALARLDKQTKAHEQAAETHRKASRTSDLFFYVFTLLVVAILAGVIGFLAAHFR